MRETIRCCISCILPCGALDVIRIVHVNGRVEEISHAVRAGEVMQAYPKHVLRKPPSSSSFEDGDAPRGPVILPPSAQLQKGKIYFLMPVSSPPEKTRPTSAPHAAPAAAARKKKKKTREQAQSHGGANDTARLLVSDQYLSEILSEKVSTQRERRRGRVGVWRPHLESISEVVNDF